MKTFLNEVFQKLKMYVNPKITHLYQGIYLIYYIVIIDLINYISL